MDLCCQEEKEDSAINQWDSNVGISTENRIFFFIFDNKIFFVHTFLTFILTSTTKCTESFQSVFGSTRRSSIWSLY